MIFDDVTATFGHTPLVRLRSVARELPVTLLAKLESRNPTGSVKDRIAVAMIEDAERRGLLAPHGTIVEATSGNTGIGLAFAAAARRHRLVLTMPEDLSQTRRAWLEFLGARVVLTPGGLMREAVERAEDLVAEIPGAVRLDQFSNPANPEVHRRTTGPEIWDDTGGAVDVFVAGVGTGGTVTGVGALLKERKPSARVVAVEPESAAVLSGGACPPRGHMIPGLGAGFVPPILRRDLIDEVAAVSDEEAFAHAQRLAREEGIAAGASSGAALAAALRVARRPESSGLTIVFMVADTGERDLESRSRPGWGNPPRSVDLRLRPL